MSDERSISQIIQDAIAPYKDNDATEIIKDAATDAAAFLAEVIRGGIPANMGERIKVAINIVDRAKGTPVNQIEIENRDTANKMLERIKDLEAGRAQLTPPRSIN